MFNSSLKNRFNLLKFPPAIILLFVYPIIHLTQLTNCSCFDLIRAISSRRDAAGESALPRLRASDGGRRCPGCPRGQGEAADLATEHL